MPFRSRLTVTANADSNQNSNNINSKGLDSDSLFGLNSSGQTSLKHILSQSKKPAGALITIEKGLNESTSLEVLGADKPLSNHIEKDTPGDGHSSSKETSIELNVQLKEMRMELERRSEEVKDLQVFSYNI